MRSPKIHCVCSRERQKECGLLLLLVCEPQLSEEPVFYLLLGHELCDAKYDLDTQLSGLTQLAKTPSLLPLLLVHPYHQLYTIDTRM